MDKYIVVTTYCDKKEIADKIINTLLEKRLVAGAHISTVNSSFWWNNKIDIFRDLINLRGRQIFERRINSKK